MKIKCFVCRGFGYTIHHCKNMEKRQEERLIQRFLNKFEVLKSRVMNVGEGSKREIRKDKKMILKEERLKKEKPVDIWKTEVDSNLTGTNNSRKKKKENVVDSKP